MSDEADVPAESVESGSTETQPTENTHEEQSSPIPEGPLTGDQMAEEWKKTQSEDSKPQEVQETPVEQPQGFMIPDEFAKKYGVKTLEEFADRYSSSSREGHRLAEEVKQLRALVETMSRLPQQGQQQQPNKPTGYFGFKDIAAYNKSLSKDPQGTMKQIMLHTMQHDPEMRKHLGLDKLEIIEAERQKEKSNAQFQSQYAEFSRKYEVPQDMGLIARKFVEDDANQRLFKALDETEANMPEVIYKLATYDALAAKLKAYESKQETVRRAAPTARPGTGSGGKQKVDSSSHRGRVSAAAEDYEKRTGEKVPDSWVEEAARAFENH